jgi:predicted nucleotidyltransferase
MTEMNIDNIKTKIIPILKKHNIKKAGIFGSFSRMKERDTSDIDILVQIESKISLLDFIGIKLELEDILHRKVDLVEYKAIKPVLRDDILSEEIRIL